MALKIITIQRFLFQLIIFLFFGLIFTKHYIESEGLIHALISIAYVVIGILVTLYFYLRISVKFLIKNIVTFLFFLSVVNGVFSKNYRLEDSLLAITYIGIGLIPVFYKLNHRFFKIITYAILIFFYYHIFTGVLPDAIFPRVSRNFISILLLIVCGYHIISSVQNKLNPSFIILFLSLIVSIYGLGRGGIISFIMLNLFYPIAINIKFRDKLIFFFSLLIFCFVIYNLNEQLIIETVFDRFNSMGLDSDRNSINRDYLIEVFSSINNLFVGPDLNTIASFVYVELNPHNSFIRLHIYYGLIGFIILIILISYTFKHYYFSNSYNYLLLFTVLLVRSYLDSSAFHGPLDPLIYYLAFNAIKNIKVSI